MIDEQNYTETNDTNENDITIENKFSEINNGVKVDDIFNNNQPILSKRKEFYEVPSFITPDYAKTITKLNRESEDNQKDDIKSLDNTGLADSEL